MPPLAGQPGDARTCAREAWGRHEDASCSTRRRAKRPEQDAAAAPPSTQPGFQREPGPLASRPADRGPTDGGKRTRIWVNP